MSRIALFLSLVSIIILSSCTKSKTTIACFEFSKDKVKVGEEIYLLNCSENFQKLMWVYDGVLDSVNENTVILTSQPGTYEVKLYAGPYEFDSGDYSKAKSVTKSYTVE
ncbi:MAG: hypothetical protein IT215_01485 [Chitinophagaceae bacterium]|nr:hypothetical protein [Chitinophagaceae bacterium]HMN31812.1 hypothetical protein [Chitinophagaceae bacterium]